LIVWDFGKPGAAPDDFDTRELTGVFRLAAQGLLRR